MDLFYYIVTVILLALHLWIWASVIRWGLSIFTMPTASGYDKSLKYRHLLRAILYDIFLDFKTWKSSARVEAINRRAKSYDEL